jgi:hypothetical protein
MYQTVALGAILHVLPFYMSKKFGEALLWRAFRGAQKNFKSLPATSRADSVKSLHLFSQVL